MNKNICNLFLAATSIAVCWAGLIPTQREAETKENCQSYFQDNNDLPCWPLGGKCYCFSTNANSLGRLDWNSANQECRKEGMALLSLESQEEDELINNHIKTTPALQDDYYWTSGRYSQEGTNRWEWATAEPFPQMNYTNWYPGYPNNSQPASYAYINYNFPTGYWFNENRPSYILYICESMSEAATSEAPVPTTTPSVISSTTSTTETTVTEETTTDEVSSTGTITTEVSSTESTTTILQSTTALTSNAELMIF